MTITFLQLIISATLISTCLANNVKAQEVLTKKISINVQSIELEAFIKKLEESYDIDFVYSPNLLDPKQKISVFCHNRPLSEILEEILGPRDLSFEAWDDVVIISKRNSSDRASVSIKVDFSVTGKVVDEEEGLPIPGVTVRIKNSNTNSITDENGVYKITVPNKQAVLIFSYIGYNPQEKLVGEASIINIVLQSSQAKLDEVVVVGYGTQKKSDVTGAVARADLDNFRNSPTTNVANLLQGTVPGLNVGQVNRAGATPSISIRGTNTISGNSSALIILDGVQYNGSLTSINPDDIATIDILKDASSTAVYGAQAANGVILITSRKGTSGKTRISFSSQYATQKPNINLRPMDRDEYLDHVKYLHYEQAFLSPGFTEPNPAFDLASVIDPSMKDAQGNILPNDFSWYDEATHTGFILDNQISISGGTDKISYFLSGSSTKNSGFIVNDLFKRNSVRANLETKAADWLTIGLQSFGSFVNEDGAEPYFSAIAQQSPLITPWNEDGSLKISPFNTTGLNPLIGNQAQDYDRHNYFFANIYANVQLPVKGLVYKLSFGNNYRLDFKNTSSIYDANVTGQASKETTTYYDYTLDNILTYNRTFGKHDFTGTLLYGAVERQSDYTRAYSTVFSNLTLGYNSLQQGTNRFAESNAYKEALNYQMFRLNYSYSSKYLLTATLRRDGFSGFAENNKSALFPSLSVGWVISKEPFLFTDWLDNLKLRASYGIAGNQTPRYSSLSRVEPNAAYIFGDGGSTQPGQQVTSLPNANLRWERTKGLNIGLEFTVLKNRLSGVVEYYNTRTTDLLYAVNIPTITGFNLIQSNVGQLNNRGFEFSLNSKNISSAKFQWSSTFNFSRNQDKIVKLLGDLNGDGIEDDLPQSGLFIGQPLRAIYDYQTNGIWQVSDRIPAGYSPGTYRVVDQNGDNVISPEDRTILGFGAPAYRFSLLNTFQYKNFTLSVFLNSIQGGSNSFLGANSPTLTRNSNTIRYNYLQGIDYWSPDNPDGKYSRSILASTISPPLYQSRSFIRLQDVSLAYRFTGKFIERIKLQSINLFVSGRNLATWTNWEGWDPETNQGLTNDGRPVFKGYSVGLNVTL